MNRNVISDTGPLIALARAGKLDLLLRLYGGVRVPPAVHAELAVRSGYPGANSLARAFDAGWMTVQALSNRTLATKLALLLDAGEAEAIALAARPDTRFLLIDESRGRKVARAHGISAAGVAGLLLVAKSRGMLSAVGPVLEEISGAGYFLSPRLVSEVLTRAGEWAAAGRGWSE